MSDKLFNAVQEAHDGKGRVVFVCEDPQGAYVYKPATGFKTKHWKDRKAKGLKACFERQIACTQNAGFFNPGEAPAPDENYSLEKPKAPQSAKAADAKAVVNKTTPDGESQQSPDNAPIE